MNYRRGLQRLYAVLTVAWIATLLFILPSDRVNFWVADHLVASSATIRGKTLDLSQMSDGQLQAYKEMLEKRGSGGTASESRTKRISTKGKTFIVPGDAAQSEIQRIAGPGVAWTEVPNDVWQDVAKNDDWKIWAEGDRSEPLSPRPQRALWLAAVLFAPPLLGYATIFLLIPWIYRGFRPATRT